MKTLIASIFALALLGGAADAAVVGIHVGGVGLGVGVHGHSHHYHRRSHYRPHPVRHIVRHR